MYEDCFSLLRASIEEDVKKTCTYSQELRNLCNIAIRKDYKVAPALSDLSKRTLLLEAPHIFDSYLQYLEIKRKPEERFYLPRRKVILRVVQDLQKLVDDELDELFISMPPRVGKTTLICLGKDTSKSTTHTKPFRVWTNSTNNYSRRTRKMTEQEVVLELNDHTHEIKSLKHRVDEVEKKQETIGSLAQSVNELAINMKYMVEEQKEQGQRLRRLESEPADSAKYYKRLIIGSICTTILGAIIGALIALLF